MSPSNIQQWPCSIPHSIPCIIPIARTNNCAISPTRFIPITSSFNHSIDKSHFFVDALLNLFSAYIAIYDFPVQTTLLQSFHTDNLNSLPATPIESNCRLLACAQLSTLHTVPELIHTIDRQSDRHLDRYYSPWPAKLPGYSLR